MGRSGLGIVVVALALIASGCQEDTAEASQAKIRDEHLPDLARVVHSDIERQTSGMHEAAGRLAPGFRVEDPAKREAQMRTALRYVQEPPKGIGEFVTSPMSFLAAVDTDGVVIARDAEPDRMKGTNLGKKLPVVHAALAQGEAGHALGEFEGKGKEESSWSLVFAEPVEMDGERVGAVVSGIPLWRLAQQLSRQMRVDNAKAVERGLVVWAYVIKDGRRFSMGTPPELDSALPGATELLKRLQAHPDGVTGHFALYGRTYGYGAAPLHEVGPDVALLVVRSEPPS